MHVIYQACISWPIGTGQSYGDDWAPIVATALHNTANQ